MAVLHCHLHEAKSEPNLVGVISQQYTELVRTNDAPIGPGARHQERRCADGGGTIWLVGLDRTLELPGREGAQPESIGGSARIRSAFVDHYSGIWRFLRRMGVPANGAGDAAQEVFLIALKALGHIVPGSERAFLYGTAARLAHGMRRKPQREVEGIDLELSTSPLPGPDEIADQRRARQLLDSLLERMDPDTREVLVLFEVEEFAIAEIAEILSIPVGTVGSRLFRARDEFQRLLRAYERTFGKAKR